MNKEIETLRKFLQAAMADENYEKARKYMHLIEYLEGGEEEDEDEDEDEEED